MRTSAWIVAACVAASGLWSVAQAQDGQWGTITGQVIWGGNVPAIANLNLGANPDGPACMKANGGPLRDEAWIVNPKNKGLRSTFVWLEPAEKGAKIPVHPALKKPKVDKIDMDQPACSFVPHALAIRQGQTLVAKNSSMMSHNFKWTGNPIANPGGNVLLPPGASKEIDDLKADRLPISIECNVHPWMKGWVRVFDHPYYAVTDVDGAFTIKDAPVGNWQMKVWHGSGGWAGGVAGKNGQPIVVKAGENKLGDVAYPEPKAP